MSFRFKLVLVFTLTVVAAVTLVTWGVSTYTAKAFQALEQKQSEALVDQFKGEYKQRADEVVNRVQGIADAQATVSMAIDVARNPSDASLYVEDATGLARSHRLTFLDLVADDGALISSKEWPARFGYKVEWVAAGGAQWNDNPAFLNRVELPDGVALSLSAVRTVLIGDKKLFIVGGEPLDKEFLQTLVLLPGMRALFYTNLQPDFQASALIDSDGPAQQADRLSAFIEQVCHQSAQSDRTIQWTSDPASAESFHAIPLKGRQGQVLGVLLVGSSRADQVKLTSFIRALGILVGGAGIALGVLLSLWLAARISRPIARLSEGAREVAAGDWNTRVDIRSHDEIGQLATNFNDMARQLASQRDRLVQSERVAAWRELARRLAHELKNPLFPLQLTIENLQRARQQTPEQFDEVFAESTATLRTELENLKTVIARFSDFAKMPTPQLQSESVRSAVRLYDAQFTAMGRPPITPELYLDENIPLIQADPDLLHRAFSNLVLNSLDAMPGGGTLTVRTGQKDGSVRVEISDTGAGLAPEECERLFTPYYTTKRHGTGLGLAVVQSIVSDHQGKISVESTPGSGATFRIELPVRPRDMNGTGAAGDNSPG